MDYPAHYMSEILNAIHNIDLGRVQQAIQIFKDARTHGRRIFVCGNGAVDSMAAKTLCDTVKGASKRWSLRFRILALSEETSNSARSQESTDDRVFVEQLKNFAEPEDVVMGICTSGNSRNVVNAIDYASWIGCRTIAITGNDGGSLGQVAELNIQVPVTHVGSIEDAHVIICHMIAYYFADFEAA
jgi:D-sedoheptulose 7-phosphate isomerase